MNRIYYRDVKACIFVHDANRGTDFKSLDLWVQEFVTQHSTVTTASVIESSSSVATNVLFSVFVSKVDAISQQQLIGLQQAL